MKTTISISHFLFIATIAFSQQSVTTSDKSLTQGEGLANLAQAVRPGFLLGSFASGLTSPDKDVLNPHFSF